MRHSLNSECAALIAKALDRDVPVDLAERAAAITARRFEPIPSASRRRVAAYFWAVVRRRAVRDRCARSLADRMVLDSIVSDLRESGCDDIRIRRELEFGWRGRVEDALLDELASRLCA